MYSLSILMFKLCSDNLLMNENDDDDEFLLQLTELALIYSMIMMAVLTCT